MKRNILLIILSIFTWINLHASSMSNDSTKLESIQKEMVDCMSSLNNRTDYNSDSYLRTTIKTAKRLNELANKYYDITNDSSVFVCSFMSELITAIVYDNHEQIDSAYVHSQRAFQLYEPYGRMICSTDSTKQWLNMVFGNDGIYGIMRDWNVNQKNYEEAIKYSTIIVDSCKVIKGAPEVIQSLDKLEKIYSEIGNYAEAVKIGTETMELRKRILGSEHIDYALSLHNLAEYNTHLGNYTESVRYGEEALKIRKKILGVNHPDYAMTLNNLANYYAYLGNYADAIKLGEEALEIRKRLLGTNHPAYAVSLNTLAFSNSRLGNYAEAVEFGTKALEIMKRFFGTNHPSYAILLNNLAQYNSQLGYYAEAVRLSSEAKEIRKKTLGLEHPDYALSLNDLSEYNAYLGNYAEAIQLCTEALSIRKRILGKTHPDYALSLHDLAEYNAYLGNYSESVRLGEEALEIRKRLLGTSHPSYAEALNNLAIYKANLGYYYDAIRLGTESMNTFKKIFGSNHPNYALSLGNLAGYNEKLGNLVEAEKYTLIFVDIKSQNIIKNLSSLSSQRRLYFWEKEKDGFVNFLHELSYKYPTPALISLMYDKSALLAKGILLNTEIEMKKLIEESGDTSLVEDYRIIQTNYEIFNKQSILPISERTIDIDSLNTVIQKQEDDLISESKAYGDYMRNLKITWKDIQQSLGRKDIAIEFLDFPVNKDSIMYVALTLKKEYDNPRMIPLFELHQLKDIPKNTYYKSSELAKLIWEPMEEELGGVKNIYFSPSGELHKIGIEYLPLDGNKYIFDKHQMYRLSSTRQIVLDKKRNTRKEAVLYGGIDYDATLEKSLAEKETAMSEIQVPNVCRLQVDSLSVRGSRQYLEGTKIETDSISEYLKQLKWDYTYYSGKKATEDSFKSMSSNCPSILHIATHGFYMTEEDARREQEIAMLESRRSLNNYHAVREDKPMTRSGLLFSGCNHVINHESIPANREDGILTAQEIASLDLRGLDLVVLSACETGLGDISSGEGVFGLQRGFKKAGANTIIMSLWKVSDKATESLMTYFYQYFLSGMTKYNAFSAAREKMRKECPSRQNKPDWAAFIMLDGIK